ncbi:MAG: ABC transporter permease, partial [Ilumatobacteraceae bacterium]
MNTLTAIRQFVVVILRRLLRDRTALFFMTVLPVMIIVIIGVTFGSAGSLEIGVLNGSSGSSVATTLVEAMDRSDGTTVTMFDSIDELRGAVRRESISAGVVLPAGLDAAVAGGDVRITLIALPDSRAGSLAHDVVLSATATVVAPADA